MKIVSRRDDLQQAVTVVSRAVSSRSTLPILNYLLLDAQAEQLTLSATDLEIGIRATLQVEVEEPGATTLPARLLSELISAQTAAAPLSLATDDQEQAVIRCGRSLVEMHGLPAEDFPVIPSLAPASTLDVPHKALKRMIQQCIIAVSTDETRARLTGIQILLADERLRLVATDGHRLATASIDMPGSTANQGWIVPARALREVERLLSDDEQTTVAIDFTDSQAQFRFDHVTIVTRLIEGEFPNFRKVIPATHEWTLAGPVAPLRESVRRCSIVSREDNRKLVLQATPAGSLQLSAHSSKIGSAEEEVDPIQVATGEGQTENLEIAFNAAYLLDILNQLDSDELRIELTASNQPAAIRPLAEEDYVYVLMPMQMG